MSKIAAEGNNSSRSPEVRDAVPAGAVTSSITRGSVVSLGHDFGVIWQRSEYRSWLAFPLRPRPRNQPLHRAWAVLTPERAAVILGPVAGINAWIVDTAMMHVTDGRMRPIGFCMQQDLALIARTYERAMAASASEWSTVQRGF